MTTLKTIWTVILTVILFQACQTKQAEFIKGNYADYPVYEGGDLGLSYTPAQSTFKVWSPVAEHMALKFYAEPLGGEPTETHEMTQKNGVWEITLEGDQKGKYYAFQASIDGKAQNEVVDPYAKAVGTNGQRGHVVDLTETDPAGWDADKQIEVKQKTDIILYELHVRDLSVHENSGIRQKGKFLGIAEAGTTTAKGTPTGLDHIKDLGVTHVHLLPVFDYRSVDETQLESKQFNWGYDPQNYNTPEGSYSTNPADGAVRIKEFKQMVKALHDKGLGVVMDVVYNHTGYTDQSNFNQLVPKYYYRQDSAGNYSNGSWCGNETASERAMVRKFMVESLLYWAQEYHIDGFRFDLMGNHDIETMNIISRELHRQNPSVFIYGEGWGGDPKTMPDSLRAIKANGIHVDKIAMFSDDARDAIKGHVFEEKSPGFVSGLKGMEESIKFATVGAIQHEQIDYSKVFYSKAPFANEPYQNINYCSAHDNHTLWDKLEISRPDASREERIAMHKLANTIVVLSQGVPFLHAGVEFLRTKGHDHNSYQSPDSVNKLDWDLKEANIEVYNFYKQLLQLRKDHPAFRMPSAEMVRKHLAFTKADDQVVAYTISDNANGDSWKNIFVAFNGSGEKKTVELPELKWTVEFSTAHFVGKNMAQTKEIELAPYSAVVLSR